MKHITRILLRGSLTLLCGLSLAAPASAAEKPALEAKPSIEAVKSKLTSRLQAGAGARYHFTGAKPRIKRPGLVRPSGVGKGKGNTQPTCPPENPACLGKPGGVSTAENRPCSAGVSSVAKSKCEAAVSAAIDAAAGVFGNDPQNGGLPADAAVTIVKSFKANCDSFCAKYALEYCVENDTTGDPYASLSYKYSPDEAWKMAFGGLGGAGTDLSFEPAADSTSHPPMGSGIYHCIYHK